MKCGDRIAYKSARGYVRFLGALPGQKGVWVGVDWDDPSRGRHDGTHAGVRYFQAKHATSASFVRAEKLRDAGRVSFTEALRERVEASADLYPETQRVRTFRTIDLSGVGVYSPLRLAESVPIDYAHVRTVRISEALLSDFGDVHTLLEVFENLVELDVSRNFFESFPEQQQLQPTSLKQLDLNGSHVPLRALRDLLVRCPALTELRLFDTGLTRLSVELRTLLDNLRVVDLGGNSVSWTQICDVFGPLPNVEELYLVDGCVTGNESVAPGCFRKLARLSLSGNPLVAWTLFTDLHGIHTLRSLQATNTPLTRDEETPPNDSDALLSKHAIIGRLPQLQKLHGAHIDADERLYAEKRYLMLECIPALRRSRQEAQRTHPRAVELCAKFDVDIESTSRDNTTRALAGTLRADLVSVEMCFESDTVRKLLPRSVDVSKVRALARRLLGVATRDVTLTMVHDGTISELDCTTHGKRTLAQLHVKRGDSVVVQLKSEESECV